MWVRACTGSVRGPTSGMSRMCSAPWCLRASDSCGVLSPLPSHGQRIRSEGSGGTALSNTIGPLTEAAREDDRCRASALRRSRHRAISAVRALWCVCHLRRAPRLWKPHGTLFQRLRRRGMPPRARAVLTEEPAEALLREGALVSLPAALLREHARRTGGQRNSSLAVTAKYAHATRGDLASAIAKLLRLGN